MTKPRKFESLSKAVRYSALDRVSTESVETVAESIGCTVDSLAAAVARREATRAACEATREQRVASMAHALDTSSIGGRVTREERADYAEDFLGQYTLAEAIRTGRA